MSVRLGRKALQVCLLLLAGMKLVHLVPVHCLTSKSATIILSQPGSPPILRNASSAATPPMLLRQGSSSSVPLLLILLASESPSPKPQTLNLKPYILEALNPNQRLWRPGQVLVPQVAVSGFRLSVEFLASGSLRGTSGCWAWGKEIRTLFHSGPRDVDCTWFQDVICDKLWKCL